MEVSLESTKKINLPDDWAGHLGSVLQSDTMQNLKAFLVKRIQEGAVIYPQGKHIFSAFQYCPLSKLKVVILGQDPYHGPGQAHGLSFSVPKDCKIPPSLKNIFLELQKDRSKPLPSHGNLEHWANQGVFLLNTVLTVEKGEAGSHRKKGWEFFTDEVIKIISREKSGVVFLLWGRDARGKKDLIDESKHLILESAHPSPFSVKGFFGHHHFSKTNQFLEEKGLAPIQW